MHSKWWQPNCQSNFLAVKPKTEGFNTILTTKLNDHVLIMASFETNNSKNGSLNTKKKKKIPTQLLQDFGSVGKGQHNIFFLGLTNLADVQLALLFISRPWTWPRTLYFYEGSTVQTWSVWSWIQVWRYFHRSLQEISKNSRWWDGVILMGKFLVCLWWEG